MAELLVTHVMAISSCAPVNARWPWVGTVYPSSKGTVTEARGLEVLRLLPVTEIYLRGTK